MFHVKHLDIWIIIKCNKSKRIDLVFKILENDYMKIIFKGYNM